MYSKIKVLAQSSTVCRRICLVALLLATGLLDASLATAQPLRPMGEKTNSAERISAIYQSTKTAKVYEDFRSISEQCRQLATTKLSPKDLKYLNSLLGWAENRLASKELENANGLKSIGLNDQAASELNKAIKRYDDLIESHPELWRAWLGRGVIHAQQGEFQLALEKFRQVLKLDIRNSKARFNCAEVLYELKEYKQAIVEYSKVLDDDATDVQALTGRGHCHVKLKQFAAAADDFSTVTKLVPDNQQAVSNFTVANNLMESNTDRPQQTFTSSKK